MIYFASNVVAKANKSIMIDQSKFYGPGRAAPDQNPHKPTRKKVYSANMPFYGSIMRGLHLCQPGPAHKNTFARTANELCGLAGCGVC